MTRILILGAGKFGLQAAQKLSHKEKKVLTVVDADPVKCAAAEAAGFGVVCEDSILQLDTCLRSRDLPDWIIPAVPLHVVFEWLKTNLPGGVDLSVQPVPEQIISRLPNPMAGEGGQVYISYADFICPDNCPEPADICTHTGKARKGILYETLGRLSGRDYCSVVVRSRQLAPGVGGYHPKDLFTARDQVLSADRPVLLSTACKCHGVLQAMSVHRRHP